MIYETYYVLRKKDNVSLFLSEDKTYVSDLYWAEKFHTKQEARDAIKSYKEIESDVDYTGDFYVGHAVSAYQVNVVVDIIKD